MNDIHFEMSEKEKLTFKSICRNSKNYVEFGVGGSTVTALSFENIKKVIAVESDLNFVKNALFSDKYVLKQVRNKRLSILHVNIGKTKNWGYPIDTTLKKNWPMYSQAVQYIHKNIMSDFDMVLIDGRFRVACILHTLLVASPECKIIVHDFWNRNNYHEILNFVDVYMSVDTLGVFKKRLNFDSEKAMKLIEKYQFIPN